MHLGGGKTICHYHELRLLLPITTKFLPITYRCCLQLCCDLSSSLTRLIDASNDSFWRTGWVYTRVQHRVAFLYSGLFFAFCCFNGSSVVSFFLSFHRNKQLASNTSSGRIIRLFLVCATGQVVLDTLLPRESHKNCRILSIKPVAVPFSERAQFLVKGFNLSRSTTRCTSQIQMLQGRFGISHSIFNLFVRLICHSRFTKSVVLSISGYSVLWKGSICCREVVMTWWREVTCWLIMTRSSTLAFLALYQMLTGEDSLRYVILALSIDSITSKLCLCVLRQ